MAGAACKCGVERNLCTPCALFAPGRRQCLAGPAPLADWPAGLAVTCRRTWHRMPRWLGGSRRQEADSAEVAAAGCCSARC